MWSPTILLVFIFVNCQAKPTSTLYEGDQCVLEDTEVSGVCRVLHDCPEAEQNLIRGYKPQRCGFSDKMEVVCCAKITGLVKPTPTPSTPVNVTTSSRQRMTPSQQACSQYQDNVPLRVNPFIYGGTVAAENEFPHMAALGYRTNGQDITWGCGGSLISEKFILTAAHCTLTRIGDPVVVRLGQLDLTIAANEVFSEVEVNRVIRHPQYHRSAAYWDIALLELAQPITFGKSVHPACLHHGQDPDLDQELIVAGWGAINRRNTLKSTILMRATLRQVPLRECNKTYGEGVRQTTQGVNIDMICAADPNGNQDTCEGDSGGALQISLDRDRDLYSLVGVTSIGPSLCGNKEPTIYTRVASFTNWIESHVWPTRTPTRGTRNPPMNRHIDKDPINPIWPSDSRHPLWQSSSSQRGQTRRGSRYPFWNVN